jgi:hypothetical protein
MDQALRNSLWNAFDMVILETLRERWAVGGPYRFSRNPPNAALFVSLWMNFYRWPLPTLPENVLLAGEMVQRWFYDLNGTSWNRVYEFVEFVGNLGGNLQEEAELFCVLSNGFLERESSAYRFVGKTISPITDDIQIKAIERAAATVDNSLRWVSTHIETALKLLSDRNRPDYRNSMKESISAVEALAKIITQKDDATLGAILGMLRKKTHLHDDLEAALKSLYHYTSDAGGIRHALKDDGQPEVEDAKFMLVMCSAFVSYMTEKARKNDLLPQ